MRKNVTFVGPIQETRARAKKTFAILVLQTGSPLSLEYADWDEAVAARRALLAAPNAYSVPTVKLLCGVHEGIQAAFATGTPADAVEVEPVLTWLKLKAGGSGGWRQIAGIEPYRAIGCQSQASGFNGKTNSLRGRPGEVRA